MWTKLIALSLIAFLPVVQDIEIRPRLINGDKFRLDVTHVRRDSARPQMNVVGRFLVDAYVISAGADGFVLDWVPGETTYDNPQMLQDPTLAAVTQATKGLVYRIALDADGKFSRVLNEAEIRPKLQTMLNTVVSDLAGKLPANQRQNFRDTMQQLLSPQALISAATQDAQIYWGLNGASLAAGESVAVNIAQPSLLGGSPIPATFRVRMESSTDTVAAMSTSTTYDKDALIRMTLELAQRAGAPVRPEDASKIPAIQMADDGRLEFDRIFGLMRKLTVNRRISAGGQDRLEGWAITLVEVPKR